MNPVYLQFLSSSLLISRNSMNNILEKFAIGTIKPLNDTLVQWSAEIILLTIRMTIE